MFSQVFSVSTPEIDTLKIFKSFWVCLYRAVYLLPFHELHIYLEGMYWGAGVCVSKLITFKM